MRGNLILHGTNYMIRHQAGPSIQWRMKEQVLADPHTCTVASTGLFVKLSHACFPVLQAFTWKSSLG